MELARHLFALLNLSPAFWFCFCLLLIHCFLAQKSPPPVPARSYLHTAMILVVSSAFSDKEFHLRPLRSHHCAKLPKWSSLNSLVLILSSSWSSRAASDVYPPSLWWEHCRTRIYPFWNCSRGYPETRSCSQRTTCSSRPALPLRRFLKAGWCFLCRWSTRAWETLSDRSASVITFEPPFRGCLFSSETPWWASASSWYQGSPPWHVLPPERELWVADLRGKRRLLLRGSLQNGHDDRFCRSCRTPWKIQGNICSCRYTRLLAF